MRPSREALLEFRAEAVDGFFFHDGTGPWHGGHHAAFEEAVKVAGLPETEDGPVTFHSRRHTGICGWQTVTAASP
jgi:hypothetical protein